MNGGACGVAVSCVDTVVAVDDACVDVGAHGCSAEGVDGDGRLRGDSAASDEVTGVGDVDGFSGFA